MDRKTGAIAGLFAVAGIFANPAGAATTPSKGATSKFGPWTPVCAYLSGNGTESDGEPKDKDGIVKQFCFDPSDKTYSRTVAIATVPDPELTHLSLFFDRDIESITWAAADGDLGDERYLFTGYWFPWRPPAGQEADSAKRETNDKERESRVSSPGLLLFR